MRNPGLKPWTADNYDVSLEYYTRLGGVFSASVFLKDIQDFFGSVVKSATAADLQALGLSSEYVGWTLTTSFNSGDARVTGGEASVRHSLLPLGSWGRALSVFANATKLRLEGNQGANFTGFMPFAANWGVNYSRSPITMMMNWSHRGEQKLLPNPASGPDGYTYWKPRTTLDLSLTYQVSKRLSLFGTARNITNVKPVFMRYSSVTPEYARVFMIYAVDPAWGFRSALSRYYRFFPDYYAPRLKSDGLMMFQMEDRVPPNVEQYGIDEVEPQWGPAKLAAAIDRDDQHGIATFPYMIVGQREIKYLPALPADYDAAVSVYDAWTVAGPVGHALTKESAASQGDIHLKAEVDTSACRNVDGRYALVIRKTEWGGNSVTFKINPNPELFADQGRQSTGAYALALQEKWMNDFPGYDGVFVDSLGANWPAVLNYRADHFAYARYPLTVDASGRVALQNTISHYEYLETLRARMRARNRFILGNGVYAYASRRAPAARTERQTVDPQFTEYTAANAAPEHYRPGAKLGRFFCAALLDAASSEAGVHATVERCEDVRVHLGPKLYAFLNYRWEDAGRVEDFINLSLCFGLFASNTKNFFTGVRYEDHPDGYLRDKKLLDWYVPLARTLSRAGWEPVSYATALIRVVVEREIDGLAGAEPLARNSRSARKPCTLTLDLVALGFSDGGVAVTEIGRRTAVTLRDGGVVSLDLEPKKAYVIQVSRPLKR